MRIKRIITFVYALAIVALTVGLLNCDRLDLILPDDEGTRMMNGDVPIGVVVALTGKHAEPYGLSPCNAVLNWHGKRSITSVM